jgi:hypothetical protein
VERILGNMVIYISLVFRPWLLVRIAREHMEAAETLKGVNEDLRSTLHTTPCKQGK